MSAWRAIEDVRRAAEGLEQAARAVLEAAAPASPDDRLYLLVPSIAIQRLREALGKP